jgi:hypothetical protein
MGLNMRFLDREAGQQPVTVNGQVATEPMPAQQGGGPGKVRAGFAVLVARETLVALLVRYPNADGSLWPGDLVYVRAEDRVQPWAKRVYGGLLDGHEDFMLVPESAIQAVVPKPKS